MRRVMQETEVKFLEIDKPKIVKRLMALGAEQVFDGEIVSENFDFPDRRISRGGHTLRLRLKREGRKEQGELTIKTKFSKRKAKIADETEFLVRDYGKARRALLSLGLRPVVMVEKHRLSYSLGEAEFEFDKVDGIPLFLEVESDSLGKLKRYVKKAGLSMNEAKPWSLRDVKRHYGRR
jgi:predicted adenylyl cyclase CyaB